MQLERKQCLASNVNQFLNQFLKTLMKHSENEILRKSKTKLEPGVLGYILPQTCILQECQTPQGPELCASGFRALRMYVEEQIEALQVRPHFRS